MLSCICRFHTLYYTQFLYIHTYTHIIILILYYAHYSTIQYTPTALRQKSGGSFWGGGGPDLEPTDLKIIECYLEESKGYNNMLCIDSILYTLSNMSICWFKESYIHNTISVSTISTPDLTSTLSTSSMSVTHNLPYILLAHILDDKGQNYYSHNNEQGQNYDHLQYKIPILQKLLYILDIYNDTYNTALHIYKQQYLCDEIETEVTWVFDNISLLLADNIYNYNKHIILTQYIIDTELKHKLHELKKSTYLASVNSVAYITSDILQITINLLGRNIDLKKLITQRYDTCANLLCEYYI